MVLNQYFLFLCTTTTSLCSKLYTPLTNSFLFLTYTLLFSHPLPNVLLLSMFSAMLIAVEIVDVKRFSSPWKLVSYAGPSTRESSGKSKTVRITKQVRYESVLEHSMKD